ncbi:type I HSP40 co-chaperone HLJ1, partial [Cyberlindnera jadinii NRRL Y-1542]
TEYYKILDVEQSASEGEIKKAYRKISLKVHPDKNAHPKADESFKRVNKAFEVLGDAQKRTIYDQTGGEAPSGFGGAGAGGAG